MDVQRKCEYCNKIISKTNYAKHKKRMHNNFDKEIKNILESKNLNVKQKWKLYKMVLKNNYNTVFILTLISI
jgi:hypothetical protein